ncbi:hypothetical protein HanPI659440_Chr12g0478851 [Helianthus annuus]|nr:hypothetical protein HanPI659440_Chr12g0478851 [Helianthus annuus]
MIIYRINFIYTLTHLKNFIYPQSKLKLLYTYPYKLVKISNIYKLESIYINKGDDLGYLSLNDEAKLMMWQLIVE